MNEIIKRNLPVYQQIADIITTRIESGKYPVHQKIPREHDLCSEFNVSIGTLRKAQQILVEKGYLVKKKRFGTVVSLPLSGSEIHIISGADVEEMSRTAPIAIELFHGIIESATRQSIKCSIHIYSVDNTLNEDILFNKLIRSGEGAPVVFLYYKGYENVIDSLHKRRYPYLIARSYMNFSYNAITIDYENAVCEAVAYLLKNGHRRIACISTSTSNPWYKERVAGYLKALTNFGIKTDKDLIIEKKTNETEVESDMKFLMKLSLPPTAVFCANDLLALNCIKYCRKANIRVPEELSIMGFDNVRESAFSEPSLSTVDGKRYENGLAVLDLLHKLRNYTGTFPLQSRILLELLIRDSTAAI